MHEESLDMNSTEKPSKEDVLTDKQVREVDVRQEELMSVESADGTPPTHRQSAINSRVVIAVLLLIVVGVVIVAIVRQPSQAAFIGGGIMLVVLLAGGWPVWTAVFLRKKEYDVARAEAVEEVIRTEHIQEDEKIVVVQPPQQPDVLIEDRNKSTAAI